MESDSTVIANSVFNLMRRLPPLQVAKSLAGVGALIKDEGLVQQIHDSVDQPLGKSNLIFNLKVLACLRYWDWWELRESLLKAWVQPRWRFLQISMEQPVLPKNWKYFLPFRSSPSAWAKGQQHVRHLCETVLRQRVLKRVFGWYVGARIQRVFPCQEGYRGRERNQTGSLGCNPCGYMQHGANSHSHLQSNLNCDSYDRIFVPKDWHIHYFRQR